MFPLFVTFRRYRSKECKWGDIVKNSGKQSARDIVAQEFLSPQIKCLFEKKGTPKREIIWKKVGMPMKNSGFNFGSRDPSGDTGGGVQGKLPDYFDRVYGRIEGKAKGIPRRHLDTFSNTSSDETSSSTSQNVNKIVNLKYSLILPSFKTRRKSKFLSFHEGANFLKAQEA